MMKMPLKRSACLFAVTTCVSALFSLPATADSTADLILNLKCQGGYNVNIWKTRSSGELLYRGENSKGKLNLGKGTSQATEGVRVYKFQSGRYEYWVWDGTLDSQQSGTLEVYKNNRIQKQYSCKKP
jgi:hypothetical protein